ncbi:hypothetical protein QBC47DRAFT_310657 [Echria macrotheca]|uniref:FAD-binding domain-containing protein n=1 Tax=Echria macrotheca TaxID=438768 RepID=A0AAJ0B1N9_9PEZI|nr:hypothetical protein QBC47DRAFT_310657 [Echria macrotheca]
MGENNKNQPRIAIVGAGLTGLLTAHGLKKAGFDVVLFDKEAGLDARPRDWPLMLHWALPTFNSLLSESALSNFPKALCNPYLEYTPEVESMPCINGKTGEVLFKSSMPGARRITRQRLRRVMAADFDNGKDIQWSKRLETFEVDETTDAVRLNFADGTNAEVDYVLGCDGASSKVRQLLFNGDQVAQVQPSGFMFATAIVRHDDAAMVEPVVKMHPVAAVMMGTESVGGLSIMYVDDPNDLSRWTTTWMKIWRREKFPEPPATQGVEALSYIKATTKNLVEPFQSQIDLTPEDGTKASCFIDEMRTWVPVSWDTRGGRITLAGDAAHPMLVYRGQGFQHAVVDAKSYVDALKSIRDDGVRREEAVRVYTDDVVERGAKAVTQSLREASLSMDLESVGKMMMAKQGHARAA